jgi:hypothetical protein
METIQVREVQKLKLNVTNINSFLKKSSKDYTKVKKDNKRLVSDQVKRKKTKEKEKTIEKKSVGGSALSNVKDVAKSSAGIFDKILSFGGILLSGILLNALPSIKKKIDGFAEENKEVIDNVVSALTVVKDFAVNLFDSFTGPYSQEGSLDWLGKFNDSGKLESGVLKEVEKAFNSVGRMINGIDKAMGGEGKIGNALITSDKVLHKKNGQTGVLDRATGEFTQRAFTEEERRRFQSGDTRIDGPVGQPAIQGEQSGTLSQQQAFNKIYNIAKNVGGAKFPEVVAAQAMHETGYLQARPSVYFATGQTNAFGQTGDRGYGTIPRAGFSNGWTLYPDLETGVKDHIKLWHDTKNNSGNYNAFNTPLQGIASVAPAYSPNADPANIALGYTVDKYSKGMVRALKIGGFDPKGGAKQQSTQSQTPATTSSAPAAPAQLTPSAAAKDNKSSLYSLLTSTEEDNDTNFFLIVEPVEVGS